MKTRTRNALLVLGVLLVLVCSAMFFADETSVIIDGEKMNGAAGFCVALAGGVIALVATFFAFSLTGLVLVGVSLLLAGVVFGALVLALSPLLLPILLLTGVFMLIAKRKHA
ncbi:MAG: hypothetical protein Q7R66_03785 [Undibacterium sp.]|uniref:hypothetical protein n=1 Tax=Undibacterium sp. TaxID=1914977 RepID=UPI002722CF50|nr:hypothetical protein [Undibacterium sp.]MDO8651289.1 hypothetical protein [Undibacterium sp.]